MRDLIKHIIFEEFSKLTTLIEKDFYGNYKRKVNNFLLSQMDENTTASMVFVSSFESKSGFAIETCAKRIARLKFGEENVPSIVNPRGLMHNIDGSKFPVKLSLQMSILIMEICEARSPLSVRPMKLPAPAEAAPRAV